MEMTLDDQVQDRTPLSMQPGLLPNFCANRTVFLIILAAELLALVLAADISNSGRTFWHNLALYSLFIQWVALCSALLLCALSRPLRRLGSIPGAVVAYAVALLVTLVATLSAAWLAEALWNVRPDGYALLRNLTVSSVITLVLLRYFYIQHRWRLNVQAEAEARLKALQARIRPHFLFNSMNTIASLIYERPEQAEQAVLDLCDLFRSNLRQRDKITLSEELELARRYLNIEKHRLGERLQVCWRLAEALPQTLLIPPLILQPLLENAVYHGVEPSDSPGTVDIDISVSRTRLHIVVANTLPAGAGRAVSGANGHGIAQDNIRQRLSLAYRDEAIMQVHQDPSAYQVTLKLPLQLAS